MFTQCVAGVAVELPRCTVVSHDGVRFVSMDPRRRAHWR
jgi:hypothetical protein